MDSNIPANPAYGGRYARICTAKLDFMNRLRSLSSRLQLQGFKSTLLDYEQSLFFLIVRREWSEKIRTRESWRRGGARPGENFFEHCQHSTDKGHSPETSGPLLLQFGHFQKRILGILLMNGYGN